MRDIGSAAVGVMTGGPGRHEEKTFNVQRSTLNVQMLVVPVLLVTTLDAIHSIKNQEPSELIRVHD
jgi:hypothetical protein